jgi:hypothetical protein
LLDLGLRLGKPPFDQGEQLAPIQLGSAGETDIKQRALEILALSKMNWNNTEGPVALSYNAIVCEARGSAHE